MEKENIEETTASENVDWEKRALKAEAKIVALKQDLKSTKKEDTNDVSEEEDNNSEENNDIEKETSEEIKENNNDKEEISLLKEELEKMKSLLEEKTIESNINETNEMSIEGTPGISTPSEYTKEQLAAMTQSDYNKAKDLISRGEAKVI